jgi:small conductance mechanosensitive channel
LFDQTLFLILLWIGLIFVDKLGDFAIDYYLNNWASEAQAINPSSNRYTLRASTYSLTLKRATTFLVIVLGIYLSISSIGINPAVLAGAGIFAVAVAFLGRNLVEDMLNGILILWTDRYAIGDVINVGGGMAGTVEDINLLITSLRNLDGESIAIPNSKISAVINRTKYWSRVNFTIRIAWNQDIDKAIAVMTEVADQMQKEPEWGERFLEPAQILGVDEVSHEGILIHLLIKTQPNEQWNVGREFRRRVKLAFDKAGISVGIPHQTIAVINPSQDNSLLSEVRQQSTAHRQE